MDFGALITQGCLSWIFQDNSILKHFICPSRGNLKCHRCEYAVIKFTQNTKTLNKQTVFMFCFCACLQICFPAANLVEPLGVSEVKTRVWFLFPFWKSARWWQRSERRSPCSSWQLLRIQEKAPEVRKRKRTQQKRAAAAFLYIRRDYVFIFRMKNCQ